MSPESPLRLPAPGPDDEGPLCTPDFCRPASRMLLQWLRAQRQAIIEEWVERLSVLSPSYRQRPREELTRTITEAFEANVEVLNECRFSRIERFITFITALRLGSGFPLSDVQRAFDLFRFIVVRRLTAPGLDELLVQSVGPVNMCLAYTIHRFSDHFQSMHDLTLRQQAENLERQIGVRTAELAESERRYKTLVQEINDGYFVLQDQRIIFANQAFCQMHGTSLDEVIGRRFLSFVSSDGRDRVVKSCRAMLEGNTGEGPIQYTRMGVSADKAGTEVRARVVDLGEGPVVIGICRDISERVAMESKIREHERLAYVGHLSASLSHEIRNPLSSVKMNLQILAQKLDLCGYDRRRLEIIVQQVSRLESILCQLLDIARPLTINLTPVNLSAVARGCIELLEPKAHEKELTLVKRLARAMPLARLDMSKIEQALINLLLNAIEATPQGGRIFVWTKVTEGPGSPEVKLGVRDTGPGIDHDQMPHLFTPFHTGKTQGSGLGLSNVKRIVDAHAGTVEVRSREGKGAAFILRLPCQL